MISTLALKRAPPGKGGYQETKTGAVIFSGSSHEFYEWKVRTMAKYKGCSEDKERCALGPKILEGLRHHAYHVAQRIGIDRLCKEDGVPHLISELEKTIFPYAKEDTKAMYTLGHDRHGILSRQPGESMYSYVDRRRG